METTALKHYTGTKTVQAQAMTLSEYMGQTGHDPCEKGHSATSCEDGYMVKFEDGYTTWSTKEDFEKAAYRCCETFVDRLVIEKEQLDEKLDKLCDFIQSDKFKTLPSQKRSVLIKQMKAMSTYAAILYGRIDMENYDEQVAGITDKEEKARIADEFSDKTEKGIQAYKTREDNIAAKYLDNMFVDIIGAIYHKMKDNQKSQSK